MKDKKIGIVGWVSEGFYGIGLAYAKYFSNFGLIEIISPAETEAKTDLDLLVLPGGPDVDPSRYSKDTKIDLNIGKQCPFRERFDRVLLPKYLANKQNTVGICRGHQSLAVYFGSELVQHMSHETNEAYDREDLVHELVMVDTKQFPGKIKVNSLHHQAVKYIPNNAELVASHPDGSIEALWYPEEGIYTAQFHPEEIEDEISDFYIKKLLKNNV